MYYEPHLETFTWQTGLPALTCDQIKMRDYMDWPVTPPKRLTSPTWGPPRPLPAARLAQLGERRSAERKVASSNPGRTNTQGLKNN